MGYTFTEEQEMLKASARDFLEKECTENIIKDVEASELGYSLDLWKKIANLGWLGLVFPKEYGGAGMNIIDLTVLFEEFGRGMYSSPYLSTVVLGGLTILEAGNEEQKSEILPSVIKGDTIITLVLNESKSSWEGVMCGPEDVTTSATTNGEYYLIDGIKIFIHNANIANVFLVPARTKTSRNQQNNITLFLIDAETPGINVTRLTTIPGDNQCEVIFDKVRVPKENIIGKLHEGWAQLSQSMKIAAVLLSAQMLGAGQRLLELSEEDYEARTQFDMTNEINRYTKEHLARLLHDVDGCRGMTYQAARKLTEGEPYDFESTVISGWSNYIHDKP